jgi:hypothetical protein
MQQVEWRIFNELGGANNRTCEVMNYFNCPYGDQWQEFQEDGDAWWLWCHINWYDNHWNPHMTYTPAASELKWYHYNEPSIIDMTSYYDIVQAIDDGRLGKIIDEHTRYMKETCCEIWNL